MRLLYLHGLMSACTFAISNIDWISNYFFMHQTVVNILHFSHTIYQFLCRHYGYFSFSSISIWIKHYVIVTNYFSLLSPSHYIMRTLHLSISPLIFLIFPRRPVISCSSFDYFTADLCSWNILHPEVHTRENLSPEHIDSGRAIISISVKSGLIIIGSIPILGSDRGVVGIPIDQLQGASWVWYPPREKKLWSLYGHSLLAR